jgi:AbrB family looped-hinge helix DNA binding protein
MQMQTSALTSKGQVTIPAEVRKRLGLHPGDRVAFIVEGDAVRIIRNENRVEAAFGLCKPEKSLSLEQMEQVIKDRAGR